MYMTKRKRVMKLNSFRALCQLEDGDKDARYKGRDPSSLPDIHVKHKINSMYH